MGRPFPLEEADEHFSRLRAWGLTFLRFLVTWEAVEHAGPGQYDEDYLDYLYAVVKRAGEHGLELFIDPHQDVWSRFSGGDGAPGWTFEAVGMDITHFTQTGAALTHQTYGDPLPVMIWPANSGKLAAATMFSLFFGGDDFASQTQVNGEPVQAYLQRHYLAAIQQVAQRLKGMPHVVGYDTLNEPLAGYIGLSDLTRPAGLLKIGAAPSPYQAMLLGSGFQQKVDVWKMGLLGPRRSGTRRMNEQGASAWLPGYECVWRQNDVWDLDAAGRPHLLRPDHFCQVDGRAVDFGRDYYLPFARRFTEAIRKVDPEAIIFVESEPNRPLPPWPAQDADNLAFAPHFYDAITLFIKGFSSLVGLDVPAGRLVLGARNVRKSFARQLADLKADAQAKLHGAPTLIGEFGIPFDLNRKKAYLSSDFRAQIAALDRSFRPIEDNLLSCTLWNYSADNSNARGDGWNGEDLSIFSRDQQHDPEDIHSGGRALPSVVRPYARATAGEPLQMSFDWKRRTFEFRFRHDPQVDAPTELFVPAYQYPQGCRVKVSDGRYELDWEAQRLIYRHDPQQPDHTIELKPV